MIKHGLQLVQLVGGPYDGLRVKANPSSKMIAIPVIGDDGRGVIRYYRSGKQRFVHESLKGKM
jgi:hypothetical protein